MWDGNEQNEDKCKGCKDYSLNDKCYVKTCMVDFRKVLNKVEETILYDADENCEHNIVDGNGMSGIKCTKCNGWFCY